MSLDTTLASVRPKLLSLLRIVLAITFTAHGCQKLFDFPASDHKLDSLLSLAGIAGILEFFGGVLLLIGLFTRPVAFVLSGLMAVAYFMAHQPRGFHPIVNGGELAVVYCWTFLYLAAAGGGAWSADALRTSRGEPAS